MWRSDVLAHVDHRASDSRPRRFGIDEWRAHDPQFLRGTSKAARYMGATFSRMMSGPLTSNSLKLCLG